MLFRTKVEKQMFGSIYPSESFILPSFFKDVFRGNVASFLSAKDIIRFAKTSRIGRKIADHEWDC